MKLLLLLVAGCDLVTDSFLTNDFSGDPFPIEVETHSGALVLGMKVGSDDPRVAVLDILSPMTVVDSGPGSAPAIAFHDIEFLGELNRADAFTQPRAVVPDAQILSLHPCDDAAAQCSVGPGNAPRPFEAIIGADALAGDALRLDLSTDELYVLADIGGKNEDRTAVCDAVFASPYRGGGTLVLAGTELAFGSRRVTLGACLGPDPAPTVPQSQRGADVLLVASTAIGPTLLAQTAYDRYRLSQTVAVPTSDQLPDDSELMPSGLVVGKRATIPALALVGGTTSNTRAPCRQVWASHLMIQRDCIEGDDCPCPGDFSSDPFCPVPAVLELAPSGGIAVLVVADTDPTLQALRTELRPDQPEVDGILGVDAIRLMELDLDYPHDRVLGRCASDRCTARPELDSEDQRTAVQACLTR